MKVRKRVESFEAIASSQENIGLLTDMLKATSAQFSPSDRSITYTLPTGDLVVPEGWVVIFNNDGSVLETLRQTYFDQRYE